MSKNAESILPISLIMEYTRAEQEDIELLKVFRGSAIDMFEAQTGKKLGCSGYYTIKKPYSSKSGVRIGEPLDIVAVRLNGNAVEYVVKQGYVLANCGIQSGLMEIDINNLSVTDDIRLALLDYISVKHERRVNQEDYTFDNSLIMKYKQVVF